jgi:hypothetical protein
MLTVNTRIVLIAVTLFASSAFAQIPNYKSEVERVARENPVAFACAHTPAACGHDFIKILACDIFKGDVRVGLNGKRGSATDISYDALNVKGVGTDTDPNNPDNPSGRATVIDVIAGGGGPNARPEWFSVTDPNSPTGARWIKPCGGAPAPPPTPQYPPYPPNEFDVDGAGLALFSDFSAAGQDPNAQMFRFAFRVAYSWLVKETVSLPASVRKHRAEWRAILGAATGDPCGIPVPGTDGMMTPPLSCLLKRGHDGPHK